MVAKMQLVGDCTKCELADAAFRELKFENERLRCENAELRR